MVVLSRIYTRTGECRRTPALGIRRPRGQGTACAVTAYGTVDRADANASHGATARDGRDRRQLSAIPETNLFRPRRGSLPARHGKDAEATIRRSAWSRQPDRPPRCARCDAMNTASSPCAASSLPGGSPLATTLHLCRTVLRRARSQRPWNSPTVWRTVNRAITYPQPPVGLALRRLPASPTTTARADVLWIPRRQPLTCDNMLPPSDR